MYNTNDNFIRFYVEKQITLRSVPRTIRLVIWLLSDVFITTSTINRGSFSRVLQKRDLHGGPGQIYRLPGNILHYRRQARYKTRFSVRTRGYR